MGIICTEQKKSFSNLISLQFSGTLSVIRCVTYEAINKIRIYAATKYTIKLNLQLKKINSKMISTSNKQEQKKVDALYEHFF